MSKLDCLNGYKIIKMFDGFNFTIENLLTGDTYQVSIKLDIEKYSYLYNVFKSNLFNINIIDYCIMKRKDFEDKYITEEFLSKYNKDKLEHQDQYLVLIYNVKKYYIENMNIDKFLLFELY